MPMIHTSDGASIADVPISQKQLEAIEAGVTVRIIFTTPQTMVGQIGRRQGSFAINMVNGKITSDDPKTVKHFDELMKAVASIRKPASRRPSDG